MKVMFNMNLTALRSRTGPGLLLCMVGAMALAGCGDDSGGTGGGGGSGSVGDADIQTSVDGYAASCHTAYGLALDGALTLQSAILELVQSPSEVTLATAREAWIAARPAYLQTEVFRFYGGPIDDEATGPEGRINGWPLDEAYIDYVVGGGGEVLQGGLINSPEAMPSVTKEAIAEANEVGGDNNLSAGWHAIEFLLWGQDHDIGGPGARPHTDYLAEAEGGTAPNPQRRSLYLTEVTSLLVDDIASVEEAWHPGEGAYVTAFTADVPSTSLTKILTGMGSLSGAELTSERINNAFQNRDQEEEHSCFSDTTHQDHANDLQGVENVYLGTWGGTDGVGLDVLVAKVDADLDARMKADLTAAKAAIAAIPRPFDQAIQDDAPGGGRETIQSAMTALTTLTATTVDVADALGVTLNLE